MNSDENDSEVVSTKDNDNESDASTKNGPSIKDRIKKLDCIMESCWLRHEGVILKICVVLGVGSMIYGIKEDNDFFILCGTIFSISYGIYTSNCYRKHHEEEFYKKKGASLDDGGFIVSLSLFFGILAFLVATFINFLIERFSKDPAYYISEYYQGMHWLINILMAFSLLLIIADNWEKPK